MNTRKYTINDIEYTVTVNSFSGDRAEVTVNGVAYQVRIEEGHTSASPVLPQVEAVPAEVIPSGTGKQVCSPLPGVIVGVKVKVGQTVKAGDVIAVLEAMKMENEIQAEYGGTVASVNVTEGESVLEGAAIVTIA